VYFSPSNFRQIQIGDAFFGDDVRDVIAVNHHRWQRQARGFADFDRVQGFHERGCHAVAETLHELHDELATARVLTLFAAHFQPGPRCVATTMRIAAHVRRAAEAGDASARRGRRIALRVHLQRGADKKIGRVKPGHLAVRSIGAKRSIRSGEKNIRPRGDITFHADFAAETVHAFHPAGFDGGNECWMRIQRPVRANFSAKSQLLSVCRKQQFNGGGVETDAVIQSSDAMFFVDAANSEHRHQDLYVGDQRRIAREQRLDRIRPVRHDDEIDP
jgi:hypothetical protein